MRFKKSERADVLVATDVAAKGLDFPDVQQVRVSVSLLKHFASSRALGFQIGKCTERCTGCRLRRVMLTGHQL